MTFFMGTAVAVAMFSALSFPTEMRFTGFGLCYNLGIVISGVTNPNEVTRRAMMLKSVPFCFW